MSIDDEDLGSELYAAIEAEAILNYKQKIEIIR